MPETTARRLKTEYLRSMKELVKDDGVAGSSGDGRSTKENMAPIVNTLPTKAQGRPLLIGAELDTSVQEYVNALKPTIHGATLVQHCCMQQCCTQHYDSTFPCNSVYNVVCKIQNKRIIRMADKDVIVGACGVIIATVLKRRRRRRRNQTVWTRGWIRNRQQFGVYH